MAVQNSFFAANTANGLDPAVGQHLAPGDRRHPGVRRAPTDPRPPQTEATLAELSARKAALDERLKSLRAALTEAGRMNQAVMAGRTPALGVALLQALEDAGLGEPFSVVGTHAR